MKYNESTLLVYYLKKFAKTAEHALCKLKYENGPQFLKQKINSSLFY